MVRGENTALMVHEAPPYRVRQLSVSVKPAVAASAIVSRALPLFVTVKVLGALAVPAATLPKSREIGFTVTGLIPVPVMVAKTGLPNPL
jgi:hypothetical protein